MTTSSERWRQHRGLPSRRGVLGAAGLAAAALLTGSIRAARPTFAADGFEIRRSEAEWRRLLTAQQFAVLREHATERPGSSALNGEKRAGVYRCAGCALDLFSSQTKYDSGTGWPSFWAPLDGAVGTQQDRSLMMLRTEVHCRRCGGHLGHVFPDGPPPTGRRYCINGAALDFAAEQA